ncbi:hypothetical protein PE36_20709 [Moritella sp. PE36]|nr:hypothetical protein PE36_20709 [Moritella sp. PE36]
MKTDLLVSDGNNFTGSKSKRWNLMMNPMLWKVNGVMPTFFKNTDYVIYFSRQENWGVYLTALQAAN